MDTVVRLRQAVSLLGRFPALAGVDLDVEAGEVLLVAGPNGAGKTTLLRALAGLVPFTAGEAVVLGHDVRADPTAVRRRVGLLGHASALYEELTVADNVRFWTRANGGSAADAEEALTVLGLAGRLASVEVHKLSAGQRRRTALAILVARRPELWLLDEPHAALDAAGRDLLDGLITRAAAAGATILVSSHEVERVGPIAGRTVTIVGGRIRPPAQPAQPAPPASSAPTAAAAGPAPQPAEGVARVP